MDHMNKKMKTKDYTQWRAAAAAAVQAHERWHDVTENGKEKKRMTTNCNRTHDNTATCLVQIEIIFVCVLKRKR